MGEREVWCGGWCRWCRAVRDAGAGAAVWRGHRVDSTALPGIDQNIMDLSSHPNSLIRMQACRSHHPRRPWTTYLRRNERAMAFPGVDSVIGSNSGLVWLRAVLRHRQRRRTLLRDLSNDPSSCLSSTLHLHTRFGLLPLFSERTCSSYRENSSRRLIRAAHCMLLATYLIEDRTFDTIISRRSSSG